MKKSGKVFNLAHTSQSWSLYLSAAPSAHLPRMLQHQQPTLQGASISKGAAWQLWYWEENATTQILYFSVIIKQHGHPYIRIHRHNRHTKVYVTYVICIYICVYCVCVWICIHTAIQRSTHAVADHETSQLWWCKEHVTSHVASWPHGMLRSNLWARPWTWNRTESQHSKWVGLGFGASSWEMCGFKYQPSAYKCIGILIHHDTSVWDICICI